MWIMSFAQNECFLTFVAPVQLLLSESRRWISRANFAGRIRVCGITALVCWVQCGTQPLSRRGCGMLSSLVFMPCGRRHDLLSAKLLVFTEGPRLTWAVPEFSLNDPQLRWDSGAPTQLLGCDVASLCGQRASRTTQPSLSAAVWKVSALRVALVLVLHRFAVMGTTYPRFVVTEMVAKLVGPTPAAVRCCQCFRRQCGGQGFVRQTGPANEYEEGRLVTLKTAYCNQ